MSSDTIAYPLSTIRPTAVAVTSYAINDVTAFNALHNASMTSTLTCADFIHNVTAALGLDTSTIEPHHTTTNVSSERLCHLAIAGAIKNVIAPTICLFGIVGNVLNLIVLTRKRLQCSMEHMEISAHMGLVALALSDLCFCAGYVVALFTPNRFTYMESDWGLGLYYNAYREALLNFFILCSTWLTVVMAVGRYMAVCRPLHARILISIRGTYTAIASVFVSSLILNSPRFLHFYITRVSCVEMIGEDLALANQRPPDNCVCNVYHQEVSALYQNKHFVFYYGLGWSFLAILIPLVVLTVCNACLIRALRQSYLTQKMYRVTKPKDSGQRITPTLVMLILMFIAFVSPSGILGFFRTYVMQPEATSSAYYAYVSATEIANCLLLCNFAINFVLYCVINVQFRRIAVDLLTCAWLTRRRGGGSGQAIPRRQLSTLSASQQSRRTTYPTTGTVYNLTELETEL